MSYSPSGGWFRFYMREAERARYNACGTRGSWQRIWWNRYDAYLANAIGFASK